jgi:hypothetical protein
MICQLYEDARDILDKKDSTIINCSSAAVTINPNKKFTLMFSCWKTQQLLFHNGLYSTNNDTPYNMLLMPTHKKQQNIGWFEAWWCAQGTEKKNVKKKPTVSRRLTV